MNFDEQLTQAFETLTERLRGEIDDEVRRRTAEIAAAASAAADATADEPAPEYQTVPAAVGVAVPDRGAGARLRDAMQAIDAARSLTALLDTLLACARAESPDAAIWLRRGGEMHRWRAEQSDGSASGAPPAVSDGLPLTIAGQVVGVVVPRATNVEERPTPHDEQELGNAERGTTNLELLTRYAARSLEALTAFKAARALTRRPATAAAAASPAAVDVADASNAAGAEEDASARRYARLLVSEIRLYHEPAVVDGRRDRDLAARLGGEITRARVMYEQRVPPHVRGRVDYFHDELVRTLCNGDASLLERR